MCANHCKKGVRGVGIAIGGGEADDTKGGVQNDRGRNQETAGRR